MQIGKRQHNRAGKESLCEIQCSVDYGASKFIQGGH